MPHDYYNIKVKKIIFEMFLKKSHNRPSRNLKKKNGKTENVTREKNGLDIKQKETKS